MRSTALARIAVGVVVERRKAKSAWVGFSVASGVGVRRRAVGRALDLARRGSGNGLVLCGRGRDRIAPHRDDELSRQSRLGRARTMDRVAPRRLGSPYEILAVTADPAEGEAFTDAGSNLVEAVPMPPEVAESIRRFIAEHHVERPFRQATPPAGDARACPRRTGKREGRIAMTEDFVSRWARLKRNSDARPSQEPADHRTPVEVGRPDRDGSDIRTRPGRRASTSRSIPPVCLRLKRSPSTPISAASCKPGCPSN